ncbi:MAG: XdhC family protein [Candidatus Rokubacteria bacterium]|nr:XdhC family protein [Candidatus Rokubacteria bacterium]
MSTVNEFFDQLDQLRRVEGRAALATLVSTRGTTPRKEGAKMWVGEGGRILGSVTIGGCVDAQVMAEAEDVLEEAAPRLLELSLGDEDAWEIGLTCGGTIEVFLEPVALGPQDKVTEGALPLYETLRAHVAGGRAGALLTRMDPPQAGAKLLVLDDGRRVGTLGDPALDDAAAALAQDGFAGSASRTVALGPGDQVRCFLEIHMPPPTLLVVGAGHVAMPLVGLAKTLGFRTVVVDGRPRLATRERFPEADELIVGIPSEAARRVPLLPSTAVVLVAHDYKYDLPVLRHVLSTPAGYVGMLGSRRRGEGIVKLLREEGVPEDHLARLRVPIGLDLGARTAPEIALAILAELVAARYGGTGRPLALEKGGRLGPAAAGPRQDEPVALGRGDA